MVSVAEALEDLLPVHLDGYGRPSHGLTYKSLTESDSDDSCCKGKVTKYM